MKLRLLILATLMALPAMAQPATAQPATAQAPPDVATRLKQYTPVRLTTDTSKLTAREREMLPLLIEAADAMNDVFWQQAWGDRDALLARVTDPNTRRLIEINYGPWDRLDGNAPFVPGVGPKPAGSGFYPADMTREEFEAAVRTDSALKSLYTVVRRDNAGKLVAVPYHVAFAGPVARAADRLEAAARLADDPGLRRYLELRARALRSDDYRESDFAWMDMKSNTLDIVIGPIETYEDQLFGYKAANEAYVLVKDQDWSRRLAHYAELLPMLQQGLPVPEAYRRESPGSDSDLGAYDAVYYAGDANAGSKTIAINLPNDEVVQLARGTRRLQLKNSMRAKFDRILVPIAGRLIAADQRRHVTFDAFFSDVMFHEVAHGLGIKNTITGRGSVREALRDQYTTMEEGKADVLGLYMVGKLKDAGELDTDMADHYVTFLAGIFRSVRFGGASAHGRANLIRFNYFAERGAFTRDAAAGTYHVNFEAMQKAVNSLSADILRLQGDGDYAAVKAFTDRYGQMPAQLQADLQSLGSSGIPVDVTFEQGMSVLGAAQ